MTLDARWRDIVRPPTDTISLFDAFDFYPDGLELNISLLLES